MAQDKFKRISIVLGVLATLMMWATANAGTLRTGSVGSSVTGSKPGQVLWTDFAFDVDDASDANIAASTSDNLIRLINPNGGANGGLPISEHPVCAMIYVFDSFQEMNACCGCPISSAGLLTLSVGRDLTSNLVEQGDPVAKFDGAIAIVAAAPNAGSACNPTANPGYDVTPDNNLLGSRLISYNNQLEDGDEPLVPPGLIEIPLHDDAAGDANNLTYLKTECGALVGNGSGAGVCFCSDQVSQTAASF